jgi:glucose-1-phosphatase
MGAYMRLDLARKGLFPATGCPDSSEIYLYADTQQRTIMSTRNTFAGLEPGCDLLPVHIVAAAPGIADPIFSPIPGSFSPPSEEAIAADRQVVLGNDPEAFFSLAANPELKELAHILVPDPAHSAASPTQLVCTCQGGNDTPEFQVLKHSRWRCFKRRSKYRPTARPF